MPKPKRHKDPDREKIPASVLAVSIITAIVILAVCGVFFAVTFNNAVSGL
ncbi:MAG: hypothetical protein K2N38_06040 [Oscillospiraceae bacterium]|nr:hypothetical protein [Oscillospiraceae bacterium]